MNHNEVKNYYIEPGQQWEIDLFRPEDAEGVRQLFLSVYGEGYPVRTYLEPSLLIAENAAGSTISSVARTAGGEIVGHNALYHSAPFHGIYESGAGLVHKDYRGGHGIFTDLFNHGKGIAAGKFGIEGIFGEAVCNHLFAQRLTHSSGAAPHAVEVDLMPSAAYTKEKSAPGRVASLFVFLTIKPKPHRVFLPAVYEAPMRYLYAGLDDSRDMVLSVDKIIDDLPTKIDMQYFAFAQVGRICVWEAGRDFEAVFSLHEKEALDKGAVILQASLNLSEPWVGREVDLLKERGYFLCGILPRWLDADALLMTKIIHRPYWEDIQLYLDRAKRILEFARVDWERTVKDR